MDKKMFSGRTHKILACQMLKKIHVLIYFSFFCQLQTIDWPVCFVCEKNSYQKKKSSSSDFFQIPLEFLIEKGWVFHRRCGSPSRLQKLMQDGVFRTDNVELQQEYLEMSGHRHDVLLRHVQRNQNNWKWQPLLSNQCPVKIQVKYSRRVWC